MKNVTRLRPHIPQTSESVHGSRPRQARLLTTLPFAAAALVAASALADDLPKLSSGHADVGVSFEDNAWHLHVHVEDLEMEYAPDGVWLTVGPAAVATVPAQAAFAFLGDPGGAVWTLPTVEDPKLLFLGLGTEELAKGVFQGDTVRLTLKSLVGPGHFALYHLDPLGNPVVSMSTRDGIDANDVRELAAGSHAHASWAFSNPGEYRLGLQASGVLAATGEVTTSPVVEYLFRVEPARLTHGHADVGVGFEEGAWDLHVHDEELGLEFAPSQVVLEVGRPALRAVPNHPGFGFLGAPGDRVWMLPETAAEHLLFLGLGTAEAPSGVFQEDQVRWTLKRVEGPGHFALYHLDPLGNPLVSMNSRDGIDDDDARDLTAGGHAHATWVFSAAGEYRIGFQASAVLAATGEATASDVVEYHFTVRSVPNLTIARNEAGTLSLSWDSEAQVVYRLQTASDLVRGPWAALPDIAAVEGTGGVVSVELPSPQGTSYFRLEIPEQENHEIHP